MNESNKNSDQFHSNEKLYELTKLYPSADVEEYIREIINNEVYKKNKAEVITLITIFILSILVFGEWIIKRFHLF